jgi:hypothetical protein
MLCSLAVIVCTLRTTVMVMGDARLRCQGPPVDSNKENETGSNLIDAVVGQNSHHHHLYRCTSLLKKLDSSLVLNIGHIDAVDDEYLNVEWSGPS